MTHISQLTPAQVKRLPMHYDRCPNCDRHHSWYIAPPSWPARMASCGQAFQWESREREPLREICPPPAAYQARNIGFGLPAGLFFKVEICPKYGGAIYAKVGGCQTPEEALQFSVHTYAALIEERGGFYSCRTRECGQFEAVITTTRPAPLC